MLVDLHCFNIILYDFHSPNHNPDYFLSITIFFRAKVEVFKCLILSDQSSKLKRCSVNSPILRPRNSEYVDQLTD